MTDDLIARIDQLESIEAIRQIAYTYALAVDARDLDTIVALYVDDIRVGTACGRPALRAIFDRSLRQFTASAHLVTNHLIEFINPDSALGLVSCRIEHEVAGDWVTMVSLYHDRYERRDGRWLFRGRVQGRLYATADGDPPVGQNKLRWPGATPKNGNFHDALPTWHAFWGAEAVIPGEERPSVDVQPVTRLRGTRSLPPPPPYML